MQMRIRNLSGKKGNIFRPSYFAAFNPTTFEDALRTCFERGIVIKLRELTDEKLCYTSVYICIASVTLINQFSGVEFEQNV